MGRVSDWDFWTGFVVGMFTKDYIFLLKMNLDKAKQTAWTMGNDCFFR